MAGKREIGIFEMSELFGITPEAIRKYEAKNIIQPKRDEENKYRKYSCWELVKMIFARSLSKEGFSLGEVAEMLDDENSTDHIRKIEDIQKELVREIIYKKRLLSILEHQRKIYTQGESTKQQIIENMPTLYCLSLLEKECMAAGNEQRNLKKWICELPFVSVLVLRMPDGECKTCLAYSEENRVAYGLSHLEPEFILQERMCVTRNFMYTYKTWHELGVVEREYEKACTMGFALDDLCIMQMYAYQQRNGEYTSYVKGYFPIKI